jgi:hypothetical protein
MGAVGAACVPELGRIGSNVGRPRVEGGAETWLRGVSSNTGARLAGWLGGRGLRIPARTVPGSRALLPVPRDQVAGAWPAGNDVILLAGQQGFECSHLHGRVDPLRVQHQDARVRLTAEGRARRETVRLRAAEMFAQDADPVQIAQIDCLSQG